ncbi:hypothetical protein PINS_up000718 [Pythium insidiosum]|nr:hypothetical protein PINS_up000718 [Pythium insidiosum]
MGHKYIYDHDSDRFIELARLREQRPKALQAFGKLTWYRVLLSVFTYTLFLSDAVRSGLGVRQLEFQSQDPDVRVSFGPFDYSTVHLTTSNASTAILRYWPYKYDSTSLAMRAVAKALRLPAWSPCILYEATCDEASGLPGTTVFKMLDELIEGVRQHTSASDSFSRRRLHSGRTGGGMTLRAEYNIRDRLSEVILPSIFYQTRRRTCQASFYSSSRLRRRSSCDPRVVHPFSCFDAAANFARVCHSSTSCDSVHTVPQHIARRIRVLQLAYPNASLELVVLDAVEDFRRGGLVSHGSRTFDIVSFVRLQQCDNEGPRRNCSTIAVDDYRYEAIVVAASEREWFPIVAVLRGAGQTYAWLRVGSLVVGIVACVWHASMRLPQKLWLVVRTLLIIPSHIVVYGSIFPVMCYAAAHILDSSLVYEQIRVDFDAVKGLFQLDFAKFIAVASVSMRSVWTIALALHTIAWISTQRSWSAMQGTLGVRSLFIAFIASWTVLAHFRIPNWRDCRVLAIDEVVSSQRVRDIRSQGFDVAQGNNISRAVLGSTPDFQFISVALGAVAALSTVGWSVLRIVNEQILHRVVVLMHSRVPYSYQWLWSCDALVVGWFNSVTRQQSRPRINIAIENQVDAQVHPFSTDSALGQMPPTKEALDPLLQVSHRTPDVLAFIVTLNLAVMSDPLVYYSLRRRHASQVVGLYECRETHSRWLLPLHSSGGAFTVNAPLDWEKLDRVAVFTTGELSWMDLLNCG